MSRAGLRVDAVDWLSRHAAKPIADQSDAEIIADQAELVRGAFVNWAMGKGLDTVATRDIQVPLAGRDLAARIYTSEGSTPRPFVYYLHGGGWVTGRLNQSDWWCSRIAASTGAAIVSLDYRLAPVHRFPAPVDDSYEALQWLAESATELGLEPSRIAIAGESAGGNLAAATALRARDESGPTLVAELLMYPALDLTFGSESVVRNANAPILSARQIRGFADRYLANREQVCNPYASPLLASALDQLPTTHIQIAELDPLHDDGVRYAQRLRSAGVTVSVADFARTPHGHANLPGVIKASRPALADAARFIRSTLTSG